MLLKRKNFLLNLLLNIILLSISFSILYYFEMGNLYIKGEYIKFLPVYFLSFLISNFITKKQDKINDELTIAQIKPYVLSIFYWMGLLSIFLYGFKWVELSHFIIYGSVGLFFFFEILALSAFSFLQPLFPNGTQQKRHFSFYFFLFEFVLIAFTFFSVYFYKKGSFVLGDEYKTLFLVIFYSWILAGTYFHKFYISKNQSYFRAILPFFKSGIIVLSILSFLVFSFQIADYSRFILFGSIFLYFCFEIVVVTVYLLYAKPRRSDEPGVDVFHAHPIAEPVFQPTEKYVDKKYTVSNSGIESESVLNKFKNIYLNKFPAFFLFINEVINLKTIDVSTAEVISSGNPYNVEVLPDNSLHLFMNLHEVNDFRRINEYFIEVNKKLKTGGIFLGRFEPFYKRRERFYKNYPYYIAVSLYFFDFIWKRVTPKLPFFQKIYFTLTKGRNRVLSKAEGLGRLYYCGFELLALDEVDNYLCFIAKKVKTPLSDVSPSYGPLFKMKRTGRDGKIIYVYKFRTMHPYSEYLQSYVLNLNGYSHIGKPADDFRVTSWGKFLRKYWLDELPQLINVLKGEMRLVGIRPLSQRFLKEYPDDVLKLRIKQKPGCVPPYVALRKQAVDEYIESERIYLTEKQKHPIFTDVKYFFWAFYNIFTNKIRSA